jgi:hypothetical protein
LKPPVYLFIVLSLLVFSCKKNNTSNCPTTLTLSASDTTPVIGDAFTITASKESDYDLYHWWGPAGYTENTNLNEVKISDTKYSNRGWYYCTKTGSECNTTAQDSIFIDVKLDQEAPPCNVTNNFFSSSNLVYDITLTTVSKQFDRTWNAVSVYGRDAYGRPALQVLFNSYNGNVEPLDGVYTTKETAVFDVTDEYNVVSVSFLYNNDYFHCHPGQKLYVTHVNGKIQVTFCDMVFSDGTYLTTCKAKMTEM